MHGLQAFLREHRFSLVRDLSKSPNQGVLTVRNEKLAGRKESLKYIRIIEPNIRKAFVQEGRILSALHHPNIPKLYDILEHDDFLFIRSEHVEGHSLLSVLEYLRETKQSIPEHIIDCWFWQLFQALFYAHHELVYEGKRRGIVHCDIKPSNVLLSPIDRKPRPLDHSFIDLIRQGKTVPFLIDFGTASFKGGKQRAGTINYLSPQQVAEKKLDWRTDLYQFALVYAECLTLQKPFATLKRSDILAKKNDPFFLPKKAKVSKRSRSFIERAANGASLMKGRHRVRSLVFGCMKRCAMRWSNINRPL